MIYVASLEVDNNEIINGNICITTPNELYESIIQQDMSTLIIREDFYNAFFTESGLSDFISNLKKLNSSVEIKTEFKYGVQQDAAVRNLRSYKSILELMYALEMKPKETMELIHMLCDFFSGTHRETLIANNRVSTLHMLNSGLQKQISSLEGKLTEVQSARDEYADTLNQLIARINFSYNRNLDATQLLQVDGCRYDKVLYIKECTRVHYVDTFIYYLKEILKTMYNVPTRLLVIEPYYAHKRIDLYTGLKASTDLTYQDIYESDIFMAGFQPKVAKDIMQNASSYNYLIVLDRGGYHKPHLVHPHVEVLYTASEIKDAPEDVDKTRVITYTKGNLTIDNIPGFNAMTIEDKMKSYSSMPLIQAVIDLMERRG